MSVELEIQDGSPHWWLSPDIWTVPGDNPEGTRGLPIVGQPCYVWALVHNNGTTDVANATVRFYWANPSVGFNRSTANHIGNANVSLAAGEVKEVLCLVAWQPVFVNDGHECVLAEAFHSSQDPLPATLDFDVPSDRHVAQRNLSVLEVAPNMKKFSLRFEIHNTERIDRVFTLKTRHGDVKELKPIMDHVPRGAGKLTHLGFITAHNPCDSDETPMPVVERLTVAAGSRTGLTLTGELDGDASLVHVVQEVDGKEIGGLSALIVRSSQTKKGGK